MIQRQLEEYNTEIDKLKAESITFAKMYARNDDKKNQAEFLRLDSELTLIETFTVRLRTIKNQVNAITEETVDTC